MNRILLGATALIAAMPALAQMPAQSGSPYTPPPAPIAQRPDLTPTRDQAVAKVREHFARMDINRDGFVNEAELQSVRGDRRGRRQMDERGGRRGDRMAMRQRMIRNPAQAFDRIDANHDGMISRDEFGRAHEIRAERRVGRGDARGLAGNRRALRQDRQRMGAGGGMMRLSDLDRDGRVSLQEATTSALQRFDRVDTNRAGRITPDERQRAREQRRALRGNRAG
jgi:Ca2+-binding EF-hand superfamily protein